MGDAENQPAFPRAKSGPFDAVQDGMSLRDWFAGQALAGLGGLNKGMAWTPFEAACDCFRIADAMLAERERR